MVNVIERFLEDEISSQELYEDIYAFITSFHIRNGEFEGNRYIIKKMDQLNFIIYLEDIYPDDNHREISCCHSIYRENLLNTINKYAKKQGFKLNSSY
ncbi:hypothetical protein RAH41_19660 [Gottfriedia acidiceleris]|uniref:hypothetical protein n=1 Tax=Gottfriedia acidiceleris TaxID=371036 RepID=UPI002F261BBE